MKFNLNDFLQLDTNGLLVVNGGNKGSKWSWFSYIEAFENN